MSLLVPLVSFKSLKNHTSGYFWCILCCRNKSENMLILCSPQTLFHTFNKKPIIQNINSGRWKCELGNARKSSKAKTTDMF